MKTLLHLIILLIFSNLLNAQITTPIIKAGFGVDADLRANYFNGFSQAGNDDWFRNANAGPGQNVIDTTGAAAIIASYATDASPWPKRMASIYRGMSRPAFTVVNNRLWLDALFIRDYHGNDTTVFLLSSKNGQSPAEWTGGIQGIPDKNDILDTYMHIRRAGPNSTDSLWMFGGLSLDNVTGNRYFDFEMYQTDIYYDRASQKWYGYGPDAGHTSWQLNAAGNITTPGDIIFSAEYQSSSLTYIEARIWIDKASLSITPTAFDWTGQFDGASSGSQYGYASIKPKTAGAFYTGLQCGNAEWAGPFSLVLQDNSLSTNYIGKQFMEFSVNLTKLGLDPVTTFGGDVCGTPFNRLVVKTRASASFTAVLKDFVAPTDLFLAPRVNALAEVPLFCGTLDNVSDLQVLNPTSNSVYTWTTANGNILGNPVSTSITVDTPGTYIVTQQLMAGCSAYATDTVLVVYDESCTSLSNGLINFRGAIKNKKTFLKWGISSSQSFKSFEVQRSFNGTSFELVQYLNSLPAETMLVNYLATDDVYDINEPLIYYRLKIMRNNGTVEYSSVIRLKNEGQKENLLVFPNPAHNLLQISIAAAKQSESSITVYDILGKQVYKDRIYLKAGDNTYRVKNVEGWNRGVYFLLLEKDGLKHWRKIVLTTGDKLK